MLWALVSTQVGTYQLSIVASAFNTPVYVCAESYKFARLFPLNQRDVEDTVTASSEPVKSAHSDNDYSTLTVRMHALECTASMRCTMLTLFAVATAAAIVATASADSQPYVRLHSSQVHLLAIYRPGGVDPICGVRRADPVVFVDQHTSRR